METIANIGSTSVQRTSILTTAFAVAPSVCGTSGNDDGNDGRGSTARSVVLQTANATAGPTVFRSEASGTEGVRTNAIRLQQDIVASGTTPNMALQMVQVDADVGESAFHSGS